MTTDTTEKGLETLIMRHMTGVDGFNVTAGAVGEKPDPAGIGYFAGSPKDYDRTQALDVAQLFTFLRATQPEAFKKLALADDSKDINLTASNSSPGSPARSASAAPSTYCARVWTTGPCILIFSTARRRRATQKPRLCMP